MDNFAALLYVRLIYSVLCTLHWDANDTSVSQESKACTRNKASIPNPFWRIKAKYIPNSFWRIKAKYHYMVSVKGKQLGRCLPSPGSWKPFLTADEGGGGGGGAAEPGRSGGSGGRDPPLWLSSPARDGSWGVAGKALEVLPFLLIGGGGGRGPGARQEANTQMPLASGLILPW